MSATNFFDDDSDVLVHSSFLKLANGASPDFASEILEGGRIPEEYESYFETERVDVTFDSEKMFGLVKRVMSGRITRHNYKHFLYKAFEETLTEELELYFLYDVMFTSIVDGNDDAFTDFFKALEPCALVMNLLDGFDDPNDVNMDYDESYHFVRDLLEELRCPYMMIMYFDGSIYLEDE